MKRYLCYTLAATTCFLAGGTMRAASLRDDWLASPKHSNTSTDRWQLFGGIDPANRDGSYTLLPHHDTDWFHFGWQGWATGNDALPGVAKNLSGGDTAVSSPTTTTFVAADDVVAHPDDDPSGAVAAAYLAPTTGLYLLSGTLTDADVLGGDGIQWFLDRNEGNVSANQLASGSFGNGGDDGFDLANVPLNKGDLVYLVVDRWGDFQNDATAVSFDVILVPEPSVAALLIMAAVGFLTYALRRRRKA